MRPVSDEFMPILRIFLPTDTPLVFIGTMMSDLLRCAGSSEVLASRHIQSACRLLVIHILLPLMM